MMNYRLLSVLFLALTLIFASIAGYDRLGGTPISTATDFVTTTSSGLSTLTTTFIEPSTSLVTVTTTSTQTETTFSVQCGDFKDVPVGAEVVENMTTITIPVLLIPNLNSTVCVRLTYAVVAPISYSGFHKNGLVDNRIVVWTQNFTRSANGGMSEQPLKNYAGSFSISTVPQSQNLTGVPLNSTFTVDYFVTPHENATGFYDESFPRLADCLAYPLAVGHPASKVNASDFSGAEGMGRTCPFSPFRLKSVQISAGMSYIDVAFPNRIGLT